MKGAQYQETFALKLEREVTTASTRGKIFDRNGEVLAYSELSYSVAIEDNGTYETTKEKQHSLNDTIYRLIQLIEKMVMNPFVILGLFMKTEGISL